MHIIFEKLRQQIDFKSICLTVETFNFKLMISVVQESILTRVRQPLNTIYINYQVVFAYVLNGVTSART